MADENEQSPKANKGEWSEIYALGKLSLDGELSLLDAKLKPSSKKFKINSVFRPDIKIGLEEDGNIYIHQTTGKVNIARKDLQAYVDGLFKEIKRGTGAFESASGAKLLSILNTKNIKAPSGKKEDIRLLVHDFKSNQETDIGLSIKSQLGGKASLLNASKDNTNFQYSLELNKHSKGDIINKLAHLKAKDAVRKLRELGVGIDLDQACGSVFDGNLKKIDSQMPYIVGQLVLEYYSSTKSKLSELVDSAIRRGLFDKLPISLDKSDIEYKVKHMLINIALGMVPNTTWDGYMRADGGYLIVLEKGGLGCLHVYNLDALGAYLFENTRLDTPSTSRHQFGKVFLSDDNKLSIKLNLQIRDA